MLTEYERTSETRFKASSRLLPAGAAIGTEALEGLSGADQMPARRAIEHSTHAAREVDHDLEFIVLHAVRAAHSFERTPAASGFGFVVATGQFGTREATLYRQC